MTQTAQKLDDTQQQLLIGGADSGQQFLNLKFANRHGLIAGATGTGKTITLQTLAEGFARQGVPCFVADVKGDFAGISQAGKSHPKVDERIAKIGIEGFQFRAVPTIFWDLFGTKGHPIRTTISDMGPLLLASLLELNDVQEGVLNICFEIADKQGILLLDLPDLREILNYVYEHTAEVSKDYGNVAKATIGSVQRQLLVLERQGAENFFGEPALNIADMMQTTYDGQGFVSVLAADKLIESPKLYATFLLWLMSELFEELPEMGDVEKPKMVFFFDEAHLLFDDAPKALVEKVEQVVKLIRSKGVGIYLITQNPQDIPVGVLGQLGNRFQHALRAFTPQDQKAVKVAAETFRANQNFKTQDAITELEVGEALVSTLQAKGEPSMVERVFVRPPESRMGVISDTERQAVISRSPVKGKYDEVINRESAFEILTKRGNEKAASEDRIAQEKAEVKAQGSGRSGGQSYVEAAMKSVIRSAGSKIGREIVRGILGSILK